MFMYCGNFGLVQLRSQKRLIVDIRTKKKSKMPKSMDKNGEGQKIGATAAPAGSPGQVNGDC